jgi:hypothetical protein
MATNAEKQIKVSILISLILCIVLQQPQTCMASTVWQDDFNDGDYEGWEIIWGNISAESYALEPDPLVKTIARHNSTVTSGTWSFDLYMGDSSEYYVSISFITNAFDLGFGYRLHIEPTVMYLAKFLQTDVTYIGIYRPLEGFRGWHNINITKDSDGHFFVYYNGTRAFDSVDDTYTTSDYFEVEFMNLDSALDNILVSNTVDITPPPTAIGGVVVGISVIIGVAIVIIWWRKEKD